jgi:hypothetical protein
MRKRASKMTGTMVWYNAACLATVLFSGGKRRFSCLLMASFEIYFLTLKSFPQATIAISSSDNSHYQFFDFMCICM